MSDELALDPLTVVELRASNVMRLQAVEIRPNPDDSLVIIGGKNAQGKSSVLNSIFMALCGHSKKQIPNPVRQGEESGEIMVDLGRFRVTRRFAADGKSTLTVKSPDGAVFPTPQTFLNEFLGEFTFDPLSFMRQSPKDQLATLLGVVDLPFDLDEMDRRYADEYEKRTVIGRVRDQLAARLAAAPAPVDGVPDAEVSIAGLLDEAEQRRAVLAENQRLRRAATAAVDAVETAGATVDRLKAELAAAEEHLALAAAASRNATIAAADLVDPDVETIESQLRTVEETNQKVRANAERAELAAAHQSAVDDYEGQTFLLEEMTGKKRQAIRAANMPLDGLAFDDNQVLFNDVPIQQCSGAEQLSISMAIGMALNPTVRVMCVPDGSLLDDNSVAAISRMASEHGYQVWLERVGNGDGVGFVIEDGLVAV